MRSNEARHEAIMQAEDHTNAVQTRTPRAGQQEGVDVRIRGVEALLGIAAQTAECISRQAGEGQYPAAVCPSGKDVRGKGPQAVRGTARSTGGSGHTGVQVEPSRR
jgi:hypothetical protein